eukprot:scaffold64041_cov35-Tisochrysis_lutea.AAC.1
MPAAPRYSQGDRGRGEKRRRGTPRRGRCQRQPLSLALSPAEGEESRSLCGEKGRKDSQSRGDIIFRFFSSLSGSWVRCLPTTIRVSPAAELKTAEVLLPDLSLTHIPPSRSLCVRENEKVMREDEFAPLSHPSPPPLYFGQNRA